MRKLERASQSRQPDDRAGQADEGEETGIEFVISCGNATKLLESIEESRNQVAVFIHVPTSVRPISQHDHLVIDGVV